jgi:hypothetical protein
LEDEKPREPHLPDSAAALKDLVLTPAARERHLEQELALLRERINLLLVKRYGPSSEKLSTPPTGWACSTRRRWRPMCVGAVGVRPCRHHFPRCALPVNVAQDALPKP